MNNNKVYILEDRGVIYLSGEDSTNFLQNLISNDVNKINESFSTFGALLSPQGKYLFEFLVVKHKKGFLIDCEKSVANDLLNQLNLYKLRSKIEILNLSNEFVVAVLTGKKFLEMGETKNICGFTIKFREDPIFLDPRNKLLGARLIINLEKLYLSLKKLNLKNSKINNYHIKSYKLGIVPKNLNKLKNKLFGIECNYEELNGIDFKKGCYVGQENTARIKLKNKLSKRLLPIEVVEGNLENEIISDEKDEIGKVLINDNYPYAIIKVKNEKFDFGKTFNCGSAKVKIKKPDWLQIT